MIDIALVEDNLQMRALIQRIISSIEGKSVVIETNNGYEFLRQLNSKKKLPDVAIIDVNMPVMDGISVTNFLMHHYPSISIIGISFHTHFSIVEDLLNAGAKGFLAKKNISKINLKEAIECVLNNNFYIDKDLKVREDYIQLNNSEVKDSDITFSTKEKMFLQLMASSISYAEIANLMNISNESIYNYQKSLKEKLGLSTRQEFIIYAIQHGIAKIARIN